MTPTREALIEAHASLVQEEIKEMAARARDEITVKVGWMIRSNGQIRRFGSAKDYLQGE